MNGSPVHNFYAFEKYIYFPEICKVFLLEGDNKIVVDATTGIGTCPWEIDMIVSEIRVLVSGFTRAQIRHIFREANGAADKLVGLRHHLPGTDIGSHLEFLTLVHLDAIGAGSTRS